MAVRDRREWPGAELRQQFADGLRERARDYARRFGSLDETATDADLEAEARRIRCWDGRADRIDRGEPVELANWEIPFGGPRNLSTSPYMWVLEPDGRLHPADEP